MKTNTIIQLLESIDKDLLVVKILTNRKTNCSALIKICSDYQFNLYIDLEFLAFGETSKPDFAIRSKKVKLISILDPDKAEVETNQSAKNLIEHFFETFIVPDIKFSPERKANKIATTA